MNGRTPLFSFCWWRWGMWFRVLGYGLHIKLASQHIPLFSERQGYRKALYLGPIRVEALKP